MWGRRGGHWGIEARENRGPEAVEEQAGSDSSRKAAIID